MARAGDAIELDVLMAESQTPRRFYSTVPAARRPAVVRVDGPIDGVVVLSGLAHLAVDFTPPRPLAPTTEYRLVVSRAVRDRDGDTLEAAVESAFTTVTTRVAIGTQW